MKGHEVHKTAQPVKSGFEILEQIEGYRLKKVTDLDADHNNARIVRTEGVVGRNEAYFGIYLIGKQT